MHRIASPFPVVHIPRRNDYRRYAVAYGTTHAAVQDDSVIPFALSKKDQALKRFEFPFFKKKTKKVIAPLAKVVKAKPIRVRTTAYTHNEWDHIKYGRQSALGTRLRYGKVRSAAADWSRYPVGTRFRIVDQPEIIYEVDDYGGALVGTGTIDLYKPTFSAMNRWGVRNVDIEVIMWGSFANSLKVLKPRTKWGHVRRMVESINKKGGSEAARLATLTMETQAHQG